MHVSVFSVKKDQKAPPRFTEEIRVIFAFVQKPLSSDVKPAKQAVIFFPILLIFS